MEKEGISQRAFLIGCVILGLAAGFAPTPLHILTGKYPQFKSEGFEFVSALLMGGLIGLLIILPVLIKRWWANEPLFPKGTQPTPSWVWPMGSLFFGLMAALSFLLKRPIFGFFFALLTLCYSGGLIYRLWKRRASR
jgi:hypothetical protein